jgi:hypothetical protein
MLKLKHHRLKPVVSQQRPRTLQVEMKDHRLKPVVSLLTMR